MNRFIAWYTRNYEAITWFLIGFMFFALLVDFSKGDWSGCLFDVVVIVANVFFVRK